MHAVRRTGTNRRGAVRVLACLALLMAAASGPAVSAATEAADPSSTRTIRVLVIRLQWLGGDPVYLQDAAQRGMWRDVGDFWQRETYGRQRLDFVLTPVLTSDKPMPKCAHGEVWNEARRLAAAAGFSPTYDRYVVLSTEGCGIPWATISNVVFGYTYLAYPGFAAHEIGHTFGLLHSHSSVASENQLGIYGNAWEIMSTTEPDVRKWHFNAFDKARLGVLTPLPCADATLRPIEDHPDAIRCGPLWAELHQDGNVWVFKEELTPSSFGAADNTRMAILKSGESYAGFRHAGSGRVSVRAP